jgi:hypothetical protein
MSDIIAEERTTLPEGATLCVARISRPKLGPFTELRAWRDENIVKMHADNIAPHNLRWYLDNMVATINRARLKLTKKPGMLYRNPKTITEFVNNMAFYEMFILEAMPLAADGKVIGAIPPEDYVSEPKPSVGKKKARRPRKAKKIKAAANGSNPF